MKLVEVKELPEKRCGKKDLRSMINKFVNSDAKFCRVEFVVGVDYKNIEACRSSISGAINKSGHKNVHTRVINDELYLVKKV